LTAQAILALQTVVARRLDPIDVGMVTVSTIHDGTQNNIIPEYVDLTGTLRSLSNEVHQQLEDEVTRALGIVRSLGGGLDVKFGRSFDVVDNDADLTALVTKVACDLLGPGNVLPAKPAMTGEDFSALARHVPGCYMRLGGRYPGQPMRNLHDPHFDIDERALPLGTAILAEAALRYLSRS
jgi:amidohydrolase